MIKRTLLALGSVAALGWNVAQADIIPLDSWNVTELNNSGDVVTVTEGVVECAAGQCTTLTVQWVAGSGNVWGAIGLDNFFYNSNDLLTGIFSVGNDTNLLPGGAWNFDDCTYGPKGSKDGCNRAGFGTFLSGTDTHGASSGNYGIDSALLFVFGGEAQFGPNDNDPANIFLAHVRYENGCSGWVGDGGPAGGAGDNSNCGSTQVPEPATLALFGLGLLGFGLSRRRKI